MSTIVSIEGNIGSGKSTLVERLRNSLPSDKFTFLQEPVGIWNSLTDSEDNTILTKFYSDQKKYAFSFQMMAYISRLVLLKEAIKDNPGKIIITERSVLTDKHVFAKMLFDDKSIEEINYKIYLMWFDYFIKDIQITHLVYIKTDPRVCAMRVKKRNRNGEHISLEYLTRCGEYHDKWINESECKNFYLDGNTNISESYNFVDERCIQIKNWVENGTKMKRN